MTVPDRTMKMKYQRPVSILALLMLVFSMLLLFAAPAEGVTGTSITLNAPTSVELGDVLEIQTNLQDETGAPIGGATIQFLSQASFLAGSTGLMEIGEVKTDVEGAATFEYVPRRNGTISIVAVFNGDSGYARSESSILFVVEGDEQLHESDAGIKVPLINKSLLAGIVGGVWAMLVFVGFLIARIALVKRE